MHAGLAQNCVACIGDPLPRHCCTPWLCLPAPLSASGHCESHNAAAVVRCRAHGHQSSAQESEGNRSGSQLRCGAVAAASAIHRTAPHAPAQHRASVSPTQQRRKASMHLIASASYAEGTRCVISRKCTQRMRMLLAHATSIACPICVPAHTARLCSASSKAAAHRCRSRVLQQVSPPHRVFASRQQAEVNAWKALLVVLLTPPPVARAHLPPAKRSARAERSVIGARTRKRLCSRCNRGATLSTAATSPEGVIEIICVLAMGCLAATRASSSNAACQH